MRCLGAGFFGQMTCSSLDATVLPNIMRTIRTCPCLFPKPPSFSSTVPLRQQVARSIQLELLSRAKIFEVDADWLGCCRHVNRVALTFLQQTLVNPLKLLLPLLHLVLSCHTPCASTTRSDPSRWPLHEYERQDSNLADGYTTRNKLVNERDKGRL